MIIYMLQLLGGESGVADFGSKVRANTYGKVWLDKMFSPPEWFFFFFFFLVHSFHLENSFWSAGFFFFFFFCGWKLDGLNHSFTTVSGDFFLKRC